MDRRIVDLYVQSHNRLFLLDYDGTLVGYKLRAEWATPTRKLLSVLQTLASNPNNQVVIVSGRDREFLDTHFNGLPLGFSAEHGYFIKDSGNRWQTTFVQKTKWKPLIQQYMKTAALGLKGIVIEEKVSSMVWHYDDARTAAGAASKLRRDLLPHCDQLGLIAERGHKQLEVRLAGVHKGQVVHHWLDRSDWDFVMAAGDDTTDEDLFEALPEKGISIKVGSGNTKAQNRVSSPKVLLGLLRELSAS